MSAVDTASAHGFPGGQVVRIKIIAPGAVVAPRPGAFNAFPGEVIEVIDLLANGLIRSGYAKIEERP